MENNSSIDKKQQLVDIARRLKKGTLSFIIGAGFSKNISGKYLSWRELLHDMIMEMYSKKMRASYLNEDEIIEKYGYLGIASEYVRRKGYHEAIDHYIEERTPVIEKADNGKFRLLVNGELITDDADLSIHKSLLDLGAHYIYTFNYDNALEFNGDKVETQSDRDKLDVISDDCKRIDDFIIEYNDITSWALQSLNESSQDSVGIGYNPDAVIRRLNSMTAPCGIKLVEHQINTLPANINDNKAILSSALSEKESKKKGLINSISRKYAIVKTSKEISKSGYQDCIFKLHGSIPENKEYGFDEDTHLHYIICQEDYDSYAEKHEAFVDLMRISLLRESFCIIGFSCDDPNFLMWMNWVKDINDRSHDRSDNDLRKYYINVDDGALPQDKHEMLNHHGIRVIDLFSIYHSVKDRKERLRHFLYDIKKFSQSDNLWEYTKVTERASIDKTKRHLEKDDDLVESEWQRRGSFPYPAITYKLEDYIRDDVLAQIRDDYKNALCPVDEYKLALLSIDDSNLPFSNLEYDKQRKEELFDKLKKNKGLFERYSAYEMLSAHVNGNEGYSEKSAGALTKEYVAILDSFMAFNFDKAYTEAERWEPQSTYGKLIKMLISCTFFTTTYTDEDIKDLANDIEKEDDDQVLYTSLQLLVMSHPSNSYSQDPNHIYNVIAKSLKEIHSRHTKIIGWHDFTGALQGAAFPDNAVEPLGSVVTRIGFTDRRPRPSNQLVMAMAKAGIFPKVNNAIIISKEYWAKVVGVIYHNYPAYCLMATALYGDKDLLKRIAQIYAFTPDRKVRNLLPTLLLNMLAGTRSKRMPRNYRNSLFIFADYFIKAVPYEAWLNIFKTLFEENNWIEDKESAFTYDRIFAGDALEYITDTNYCNEVIAKCLKYNNGNITDYQNRLVIAARKGLDHLSDENANTIYSWMTQCISEVQAFVILNLHELLDTVRFQNWLVNLPDRLMKSDIVLEAVCAYINNVSDEQRIKLSHLVANSHGLWANGIAGIKDSEVSFGGGRMLNMDEINAYLTIGNEDLDIIYEKLKASFDQIKRYVSKGTFEVNFNHWDRLIRSMINFLVKYETYLSTKKDYQPYVKQCKDKFLELRGGAHLYQLLVSSDETDVQKAVIDLNNVVYANGIEGHLFDYQALASTIIHKSTKALETCLDHFSWAVGYKKYKDFFVKNGFADAIMLILKVFAPYFIAESFEGEPVDEDPKEEWTLEADKDHIEKDMLRLCAWLKEQKKPIGAWEGYEPVYMLSKIYGVS